MRKFIIAIAGLLWIGSAFAYDPFIYLNNIPDIALNSISQDSSGYFVANVCNRGQSMNIDADLMIGLKNQNNGRSKTVNVQGFNLNSGSCQDFRVSGISDLGITNNGTYSIKGAVRLMNYSLSESNTSNNTLVKSISVWINGSNDDFFNNSSSSNSNGYYCNGSWYYLASNETGYFCNGTWYNTWSQYGSNSNNNNSSNGYYCNGTWYYLNGNESGYYCNGTWYSRPNYNNGNGYYCNGTWFDLKNNVAQYYCNGNWHDNPNYDGSGGYYCNGTWYSLSYSNDGYYCNGVWHSNPNYVNRNNSKGYYCNGTWYNLSSSSQGYYCNGNWFSNTNYNNGNYNGYYCNGTWYPLSSQDSGYYCNGTWYNKFSTSGNNPGSYYCNGSWHSYGGDNSKYYCNGSWHYNQSYENVNLKINDLYFNSSSKNLEARICNNGIEMPKTLLLRAEFTFRGETKTVSKNIRLTRSECFNMSANFNYNSRYGHYRGSEQATVRLIPESNYGSYSINGNNTLSKSIWIDY